MSVEERSYSVEQRAGAAATLRGVLVDAPGLPAQAAALLALLYLAATDGGYHSTDWYPVGLGILTLLAVWATLVAPGTQRDRLAAGAGVLLLLFAAWALGSIGWADERSAAWDGGNRALLYA